MKTVWKFFPTFYFYEKKFSSPRNYGDEKLCGIDVIYEHISHFQDLDDDSEMYVSERGYKLMIMSSKIIYG